MDAAVFKRRPHQRCFRLRVFLGVRQDRLKRTGVTNLDAQQRRVRLQLPAGGALGWCQRHHPLRTTELDQRFQPGDGASLSLSATTTGADRTLVTIFMAASGLGTPAWSETAGAEQFESLYASKSNALNLLAIPQPQHKPSRGPSPTSANRRHRRRPARADSLHDHRLEGPDGVVQRHRACHPNAHVELQRGGLRDDRLVPVRLRHLPTQTRARNQGRL
jgi:hypothetical protein